MPFSISSYSRLAVGFSWVNCFTLLKARKGLKRSFVSECASTRV